MIRKSLKYKFLLITVIILVRSIIGYSSETDSIIILKSRLHNEIATTTDDSVRAAKMIQMAVMLHASDAEIYDGKSGQELLMDALSLVRQKNIFKNIGYFIDSIAVSERNKGNYSTALRMHQTEADYASITGDSKLLSMAYNNIGVVYRRIDDYKKALSFHFKALELSDKREDSASMAISINSIGNLEIMLGDYDEALKYFTRSLKLEETRSHPLGIAINLNNIGAVYFYKKIYSKAIEYYKLSLDINKKIGSQKGIAICYGDIAEVYSAMGKFNIAEQYLQKSLAINKKLKDKLYLSGNYLALGNIYLATGRYAPAEEMFLKGLEISSEIGVKSNIEEAYRCLYQVNKKQKKFDRALQFLEKTNIYHDSVLNLNIQKDIARLQIQFETEQKENKIKLLEQQAKIRELNLNKQKFVNYFLLTAFVLALIIMTFLSVYIINKNKINNMLMEKNREIEKAGKDLELKSKELLKAKQKVEESDRSKSEFLANMSHEIRTPLNSVIGFSGLLAELTNDPKKKEYIKSIENSGKSLLTLINDILDLSKIEAGKLDIRYEEVDIRGLLEEVKQMFRFKAESKNLSMDFVVDPAVPRTILFSPNRLRQILLNLVGNALKFTYEGGITVHVQTGEDDNIGKTDLKITVKDTGIGIAKEEQEKIFNPFYQSENKEKEMGAGLGLSITQKLVTVLNGTISVKSEPGTGTEFELMFKNIKVVDKDTTEEESEENQSTHKDKLPLCILSARKRAKNNMLVQYLSKRVIELRETGTDLTKLRKMLEGCDLIIIEGMDSTMTENTLQLLFREAPGVWTLIIGNPVKSKNSHQLFINPSSLSDTELIGAVEKTLQKIFLQKTIDFLFTNADGKWPESGLREHLWKIYHNEFQEAKETRLIQKISVFIEKLESLAQEYNLPFLSKYVSEFKRIVETFDISGIDKKINIFNQAYLKHFEGE